MPLTLAEVKKSKVGSLRFKKLKSDFLLTNDVGEYSFLSPAAFEALLTDKTERLPPDVYASLKGKGFIRNRADPDSLTNRYVYKNSFLGRGPNLHIVVTTLRCDHKCIYCQAGSSNLWAKGLDMDLPTAKKVVDIILSSPGNNHMIEFQGGEPLINWEVIKYIVNYARDLAEIKEKKVFFSFVSNLAFLNKEKINFIIDNDIAVCVSFDGPKSLHNRNRKTFGRNKTSYEGTVTKIKLLMSQFKRGKLRNKPNAIITITKYSLGYHKAIVDEYMKLGFENIHLRPVTPFGVDEKTWNKISFGANDFIKFYKMTLDYIIELNLKGHYFFERTASIFLEKILGETDPNFLDMRSPCGAGIGQLAYMYNGDVYTCDEGRMLSRKGDESFRIGNVKENSYEEIITNEVVKTMCIASCLDNLPGCSQCVYKPYCGVCPLYNYAEEGDIFSQQPNNQRCLINKAILDYLFEKLQVEKDRKVLSKWIPERKEVL